MVRLSPCRSPAPDEFFLRGLEFGKALLKINKGLQKMEFLREARLQERIVA